MPSFWEPRGWCWAAAAAAVLAADFAQLGIGFAGVALAFGLTVLTMVYALGPVSGGHFNPAVTVGLAFSGRFPWSDVVQYVIAQVLGGIAGAAILYVVVTGKAARRHRQLRHQRLRRALAGRLRPARRGRSSRSS